MKINAEQKLKLLAARAQHLNVRTFNGQPINVAAQIDEDLKALADPAAREEAAKLMNAARGGDVQAQRTLNAVRIERWNNFVLADANRVSFFAETVVLADNETPMFVNESAEEVRISSLGLGAGLRRFDPVKSQAMELIPLKQISTDEFTFTLRDLYNGSDVSRATEETLQVAAAMTWELEKEIQVFLDTAAASGGAFGTFTFTGSKLSRIYVPQTGVNTSNFPTTNTITLTGNSSSTKFRPEVFKAILQYCVWGKAFMGQELIPTGRILVPSGDGAALLDGITPTSAKQTPYGEALLATGWMNIHYGRDWTLVPDNTLPPGACYPEFNIKPIRLYTKPSQDQDHSTGPEDYELAKRNQRKRYLSKVIGSYLNASMRHSMVKIVYTT